MTNSRDPRFTNPEVEGDQAAADTAEAAGAPSADEPADTAARSNRQGSSRESEQLLRLEAERDEMRQLLIRRQADFDNFRKRVERERKEDRERAIVALGQSLLPVLDNFERALAAHQDPAYEDYRRGFEMIYRQLLELLASAGIARMETSVGKPFDPHFHHAVERIESAEYPDGTIIEELQAGFKFRDRVLRPAQVRVAANPEDKGKSASQVN